MYTYNCQVLRVIDGDTIEANIDLGFSVWLKSLVRLYGIDAPELRGATLNAGIESKNYLISLVSETLTKKTFVIQTHGKEKDKYGRVLGTLFVNGNNVSDIMITEGFAVVYKEK